MAKRRLTRKKILIAGFANICLLFFTLVITFASISIAWFNANKNVSGGGIKITFKDDHVIQSVITHQYYSMASQGDGVFTFDKQSSSNQDMGKYSMISSEYQIVLEIRLTQYGQEQTNLKLKAHSNAEHYMAEFDSNNQLIQELDITGNSLSSIVNFYYFDENTADESHEDYIVLDTSDSSQGTFVQEINSKKTIQNELFVSNVPVGTDHFYILLDYNIFNIEEIFSANIGNSKINDITNMDEDGNIYLAYDPDFYFYFAEGNEA